MRSDVIFEWPLNYWMTHPTFFSLLEVVSKAPLFVSFSVYGFLQMLLNGVEINTDLESFLSFCISSQPPVTQLLVDSPSVYLDQERLLVRTLLPGLMIEVSLGLI